MHLADQEMKLPLKNGLSFTFGLDLFSQWLSAEKYFLPVSKLKKHCQRHNGPRVLTSYLALFLKLRWKQAAEIIRSRESIPWVRCASGNVYLIDLVVIFHDSLLVFSLGRMTTFKGIIWEICDDSWKVLLHVDMKCGTGGSGRNCQRVPKSWS